MTSEPVDIDAASQRAREAALALAAWLPEVKPPTGTRLEGAYLGALVQAGRRHPDREARRLAHVADAAWWSMALAASHVATRWSMRLSDTSDQRRELYQAGVVGLYEAAQRYDPARGTPFPGYAARWVMSRAARERYSQLVRAPDYFNGIRLKARGLRGSVDDVAAIIGCSPDDLMNATSPLVDSMDFMIDTGDGEHVGIGHATIGNDPTDRTNDSIDIESAIGRLCERDQRVARLALSGMSDAQIAAEIGVTTMGACQFVSRIAMELRAPSSPGATLDDRLVGLIRDGHQVSGKLLAKALGLRRSDAVALLKNAVREGRIAWDKARRRYVEAA